MNENLCESCNEREGVMNSRYMFHNSEDETGMWTCEVCEQEAEEDHNELTKDWQ
jgi:hypothetical protein